jgi:hypothetical protein
MHKITKLKAVENASFPTASTTAEYRATLNEESPKELSPNVDYWIIGEIIQSPVVGESMIVDRWNRNGVICRGIFQTSKIVEITETGIKTQNSEYKIEEVEDEEILTCGN